MPVHNQGTLDFMSVEVELQHYSFMPKPAEIDLFKLKVASRLPALIFRYNPLHDLESLWWIAVWMMFTHRDDRVEQEPSNEDEESQSRYAERLFPRIINGSGRLDALKNHVVFLNMLLCLPEAFYAAASKLESIRQTLVEHYYLVEGGTEINEAAFGTIHELFLKEFSLAKSAVGVIQLRPLTQIYTLKRSRQNSAAAGSTSPTPNRTKRTKAAVISLRI
jgi:hypothetical protein